MNEPFSNNGIAPEVIK